MKILLVLPPASIIKRWGRALSKVAPVLPPLGVAYIASVLEKNGYSVKICDCHALEMDEEEFMEYVKKENPDVIGFTVAYTLNDVAKRLSKKIKEIMPNSVIIWGGAYPSIKYKEILQESPYVDIVVIGEGEFTFLELIQALEKKKRDFSKIKGLAYRDKNKKIRITPRRPYIENLDILPFPARHLLPMEKYRAGANGYKRLPMMTMICSRGCVYRCTFCSSKDIFGRTYRVRSPENILAEMKFLKERYRVREIDFWDDVWGWNRAWIEKFCNLVIKEKLDIVWACETRVNLMDEGILRKMKKAGCWNIFYGIESGNQQLLNNVQKDITLEQIRKAVRATKRAGIEIRGNFMLGLPGETPETAQETIDFAKKLNPDYVKFNMCIIWPGTKLYEHHSKFGRIETDYTKLHTYESGFVPYGYKNKEEIIQMSRRGFKQFYYRPSYILGRLMTIRSFEDIRRYVRGFLAIVSM